MTSESDILLTEDAIELSGVEIVAQDPETDRATVRIDLEEGALAVDDEVQLITGKQALSALEIGLERIGGGTRDSDDSDDSDEYDLDLNLDVLPDPVVDDDLRRPPELPDYLLTRGDVRPRDVDRLRTKTEVTHTERLRRVVPDEFVDIDVPVYALHLVVGAGFAGVKLNDPMVPATDDDDGDGEETSWVSLERYVEDAVDRALEERGVE